MNSLSDIFNKIFFYLSALPFEALLIILCCASGGIFLATLVACAFSPKIRRADKKPFFHLSNAFSALALSLFLTEWELARAVAAAAIFWCFCYLLYGVLCLVSRTAPNIDRSGSAVFSALPAPRQEEKYSMNVPAAKNSVRLEHALSIADKLLLKNLGKGDRQELEKMKTTLTILQIKGSLTPQEGEILNDNFNALLKLMAKYNL
jgi:hypothetical protein